MNQTNNKYQNDYQCFFDIAAQIGSDAEWLGEAEHFDEEKLVIPCKRSLTRTQRKKIYEQIRSYLRENYGFYRQITDGFESAMRKNVEVYTDSQENMTSDELKELLDIGFEKTNTDMFNQGYRVENGMWVK